MRHQPNPVLNKEEQTLLDTEPEACFRHAVHRGAISLDEAAPHLSPRIAAVVRCIATGERLDDATPRSSPLVSVRSIAIGEQLDAPAQARTLNSWERAQKSLAGHPQLTQMLNERTLTADEALQAAQAMDHILGRYPTGTRYAAP